jgi:modulator of FtsH protease
MTQDWQSFYVMVGGAAAALTGLIFVAVSLHTRSVMGNVLHRDRAWSSIALLLSQMFVSIAILAPSQPDVRLGAELDLIAAFWIYRTVWASKALGPRMRQVDRPRYTWQVEWTAWIAWLAALVIGSIAITAGNADGLVLLAIAMVGMFGFAVWSSWVLISEVAD